MGLDLILGALILIGAVRGWFRGFLLQAVGLASLAGCVYLADPVRDLARPYGRQYLPTIQHDLLDRLLWWVSAVISYLVLAGLATWVVRASRPRTPFGQPQPNYSDQGAGFVLGGGKALLVAAFIASGIARYVPEYIKAGGWVGEQVKTSRALGWTAEYKPVDRIWNSPPVQSFVAHVRARGFGSDPVAVVKKKRDDPAQPPTTARAPSRPRPLAISGFKPLNPASPDFLDRVEAEIQREGLRALKSR